MRLDVYNNTSKIIPDVLTPVLHSPKLYEYIFSTLHTPIHTTMHAGYDSTLRTILHTKY